MAEVTVGDWQRWVLELGKTDELAAAILGECGLIYAGPAEVVVCSAPGMFAHDMLGRDPGLQVLIDDKMIEISGRSVVFVDGEPHPELRPSLVLLWLTYGRHHAN